MSGKNKLLDNLAHMKSIENIFLDLDNTIICSVEFENLDKVPKESYKHLKYKDMDNSYRVFYRPYLEEFLDYIFSEYRVSVWTAASKDYAFFIIDNIILSKPNRRLDVIMYDYHVDISEDKYDHPKYLKLIIDKLSDDYSKNNTIIIDDNKYVHTKQPKNIIKADYFEVLKNNAYKDTFLLDVIKKLKEKREQS